MVITIFRSRLRPEHVAEYQVVAERIETLAHSMPGFVAIKTFAAEDGERVSIVQFDSHESHLAWRSHPEHRAAQQQGRDRFYSEYSIDVCDPVRSYAWALGG